MAETTKPTVQCTEETKTKLIQAAATLKWSMPEVVELAADLLAARIEGEETPAQKKARILGTADNSATGARHKSNNSATPVGVVS